MSHFQDCFLQCSMKLGLKLWREQGSGFSSLVILPIGWMGKQARTTKNWKSLKEFWLKWPFLHFSINCDLGCSKFSNSFNHLPGWFNHILPQVCVSWTNLLATYWVIHEKFVVYGSQNMDLSTFATMSSPPSVKEATNKRIY